MALRVAVLVSAVRVVAGSGCGLAEDFPAADEIFWSKGEEGSTSGQCLSKAMQMSYLDQRYRDAVRATDSGGALRMLVKNWDSHIFNSAILTILLEEVLGYPPPTHCTTNTGFTAGSFDLLSEMSAGRPAEVDIDMELWASSSFPEYQDATGRYSNAGSTFSYGRSGLFLRPGGTEAQREMLVSLGRSYNNLERDVLPLLPTLAQAQQLSIWCNSDIGSGAHCKEVPNRACFDIAASDGSILDRCRVLFKSYNSADAGLVETMIQNSSLPLVIVYTGDSKGFDYLDEMPNQTVLFYHWEPALVIAPDTDITRVVFDDPVFCEPDQSFSALPPTRTCDFRLGLVHKGYASRVKQLYPDIAYLIDNYNVPAPDIFAAEAAINQPENTYRSVACDWILANTDVWQGWLLKPHEPLPWWKEHIFGVTAVCVVAALTLLWISVPLWYTVQQGSSWFHVSNYLKPLDIIRATCLNPFRRIQQVRKNKKTNNASTEEQFPVGTRVKHAARGLGTVTQIMEDGRTVVTFDDPKKGMHRYKRTAMHKLEKVSASGIVPVELNKMTSAAVKAAKQSTSTLAVVLGLKTIAVEQERTFSSKERAAAVFLQTFKKTKSLSKAIGARARLQAKLIEGVQFAQRDTYGVQGNSQFRIGLVRGRTNSHETFTATIEVSRKHASTLVEGQDFILPSKEVTFFPGQRFASIAVELLDTPVRMAGDVNKAWLPIRETVFALSAGPDQDPNAFGVATECRLKIVDKDPWPTAAEQKRSTYMTYVMMIFRANLEKEVNWFVGVLLRGITGKIIKNILFIVLFDVAVLHRSLDWAFVVGAGYLLCELIEHITSYWFNSGWMLGYNVPMTWVLAKWTQLPAVAVADVDTIEKYRIVTELIATDFFSKNTYPAFTGLISTCVDIVLITIAPIVLFNLDFCSRRDSNGICTLYDSVGFAYTEETFNLSIIVAGGTVAAVCVYFVVDAFTKKPTRYEREVQKWVELEGKFHLSEQDLLNNTALHRNFEKHRVELSSAIRNMSSARDQKGTYLQALNTAGTSFHWMMKLVYIGIMLAAPLLYGVLHLTIGQLYALFSLVAQTNTIFARLLSVRERMAIGTHLIAELATLLNDRLKSVKRQLQELDVEHVHITFTNVHYVSTLLYDVHGHYLQVTVEGQLPIGHLYGLASRSTGDALAHQQEMEHRVVCDLLGGARTPTGGAVVIAPHLTVGIVQHTPKFNMDSTLLENLLYGISGRVHVPETTVWHLLKALGLPRYLCNSEGGATPMGAIALSQQEQQLLSLARTLICEPDVLIVHNLGYFRSSFSARVGSVLKMYTDGYPLSKLSGGKRSDQSDSRWNWWDNTAIEVLRDAENAELQGETDRVVRQVSERWGGKDERPTFPSERRTVIWHAYSGVLDDAGVIRKVHLSRDRVRKLEPSDGEATSECVGPSVNVEARVARETPSNARRPPSTSPTTHLGGDNDSEASQED